MSFVIDATVSEPEASERGSSLNYRQKFTL